MRISCWIQASGAVVGCYKWSILCCINRTSSVFFAMVWKRLKIDMIFQTHLFLTFNDFQCWFMGPVAAKIIWTPQKIQLPHGKNLWACSLQVVEFWAPHFSRKARILYLLKYVHTMGHDYSEILYILNRLGRATFPFFLFDTLEPRRNSTNTAVVSGHVVAKGHEVIEDKSVPTCKEVAMSRRGLQLHFL